MPPCHWPFLGRWYQAQLHCIIPQKASKCFIAYKYQVCCSYIAEQWTNPKAVKMNLTNNGVWCALDKGVGERRFEANLFKLPISLPYLGQLFIFDNTVWVAEEATNKSSVQTQNDFYSTMRSCLVFRSSIGLVLVSAWIWWTSLICTSQPNIMTRGCLFCAEANLFKSRRSPHPAPSPALNLKTAPFCPKSVITSPACLPACLELSNTDNPPPSLTTQLHNSIHSVKSKWI